MLGQPAAGRSSLVDLTIAIPNLKVKVHVLDDDTKVLCALGFAVAGTNLTIERLSLGVLDIEDGLAVLDECGKRLALAVLDALLVDGEVHVLEDIWDDVAGVLEADGHVVAAGF